MTHGFDLIIACETLRDEIEHFQDIIKADIFWIEHALHNFPAKLNAKIKEKICDAEAILEPGSTVLLFFGICGGALEGIESETLNLIYPDVHDCIPIILGSLERFGKLHAERPGTFYLNRCWIESGEDPLGSVRKYTETYGEAKGWKAARLMYNNYTHFTLVDNGSYDLEPCRGHVKKACELFGKDYSEEKGSLDFVEAILKNQCKMRKILANNQKA